MVHVPFIQTDMNMVHFLYLGESIEEDVFVGLSIPQLYMSVSHTIWLINKSQYWPRGAPKHAETAENEKA